MIFFAGKGEQLEFLEQTNTCRSDPGSDLNPGGESLFDLLLFQVIAGGSPNPSALLIWGLFANSALFS